jgi:outer membrane protein assembly factor BamB
MAKLKDMLTLLLVCLLQSVPPQVSGDWPGLWGPARDGNATTHGVPARPRGFKELWRRRTTGGYSEMVVEGERAFTMELHDGIDYVVALESRTGRDRWRAAIGPTYRGHEGSHDGPISTPAVAGRDVFAIGPHGQLVALEADTGRERWRHDLVKEFQATPPLYGFATSPLVESNAVIVQTGGEKSMGLIAFDRANGRRLWSASQGTRSSYASPIVGTIAGTRQIVAATGDRVYAVAPGDGRVLWSISGPGDGEGVANAPIVLPDDRVLLTYWAEAVLVRVVRQGHTFTASEVWRSPRIRGAYGPTVYRDGYLYGFNGSFLICLDAATNEVRWRQRIYEGTLVGAGRHLFVLARGSGMLHVIEASPGGFAEIARTQVFTAGASSLTGPSVVGSRVYLRNLEEMVAFAIEG